MARRPSSRGVKLHFNYSVEEAARATGHCKGTVRRWLKNGLPAIIDQKPALILGGDLIDYLKGKRSRKQKCRLHECFCFSCRRPRAPAFGEVELFMLAPSSGNLRALCEHCTTVMHKRISVTKISALQALATVTIRQGIEDLSDSRKPCPNAHLPKEAKPHA
jgi:hypothetical protein